MLGNMKNVQSDLIISILLGTGNNKTFFAIQIVFIVEVNAQDNTN